MKLLNILLLPFTLFWAAGVWLRNRLYDWGILSQVSFDFPVIGVGNLSVGGTGKTPTVEYLVRLCLENGLRPAIVSRGYKRKSRGFYLLDKEATAEKAGDEAYQLKRKFPEIPVAVCKNRAKAIKRLREEVKGIDVFLLDDSFQHRKVKPGLNILLTPYSQPFSEQWLLPAGRLREPKGARKRADIIVITKNPIVLSPFEERRLLEALKPFPHQKVFFSYISYGEITGVTETADPTIDSTVLSRTSIMLFTGIANATPLKYYLERKAKEVFLQRYPDHHRYKEKDLKKIRKQFDNLYTPLKVVVTTEKDLRRLEHSQQLELLQDMPFYYLPIRFLFHKKQQPSFDEMVLEYINKNRNPVKGKGKNKGRK